MNEEQVQELSQSFCGSHDLGVVVKANAQNEGD